MGESASHPTSPFVFGRGVLQVRLESESGDRPAGSGCATAGGSGTARWLASRRRLASHRAVPEPPAVAHPLPAGRSPDSLSSLTCSTPLPKTKGEVGCEALSPISLQVEYRMPFYQKLISCYILDIALNVYLQMFQAPCDRADNGSNEY